MNSTNRKAGLAAAFVLAVVLACAARAEYAGAPGGMEVEWQSVPSGISPIKAWVKDDVILLESKEHSLVALRRSDGVHLWRCDLENNLRFAPAVSRNNVLVNVNNFLIAIEKSGGNIRWKLETNYIMSNEPLIIDPPLYPREYTANWQNLEAVYVAGWDTRIHALWTRGKLASFFKGINTSGDFLAPNFDLSQNFVKANKNGAITTMPFKMRDNTIYWTSDNSYINSMTRDGEEAQPYFMLGQPTTEITLSAGSLFIGSQDLSVYCLDRLTLRKKWIFAAGKLAKGRIFADEPQTPLVYVPLIDGNIQALRVSAARPGKKGEFETPERMAEFWKVPGDGTVTAGPLYAYIGTGPVGDHAYKSVTAVDKGTGKTAWTLSSHEQYLEYHNNWSNDKSTARIYAIGSGGTVVSFKEVKRETGVQIAKLPVDAEPEKMPVKITPKKKEESDNAAKPDEPKKDAPPKEEPKKEEPKKEEPKKEEPKKEEAAKPEEKK